MKQINTTVVSHIPKVSRPMYASQYRPISCCNVLYKCIFKLLCNIMAKVLPELASDNQVAFVKERSLVHNVLMCHDNLRHYNRQISPRCLMKIDLQKAYDTNGVLLLKCWKVINSLHNLLSWL